MEGYIWMGVGGASARPHADLRSKSFRDAGAHLPGQRSLRARLHGAASAPPPPLRGSACAAAPRAAGLLCLPCVLGYVAKGVASAVSPDRPARAPGWPGVERWFLCMGSSCERSLSER